MGDGDAAIFDKRDEFVVEVCDVCLESLWAEETKLKKKKRKKKKTWLSFAGLVGVRGA